MILVHGTKQIVIGFKIQIEEDYLFLIFLGEEWNIISCHQIVEGLHKFDVRGVRSSNQ